MTPSRTLFRGALLACLALGATGCPPHARPHDRPSVCTRLADPVMTLADKVDPGRGVFAVSIDGCRLELLAGCTSGAHYVPKDGPPGELPRVLIANQAELVQVLPLDAGALSEQLEQSSQLVLEASVKSEAVADREPSLDSFTGDCSRATHYADHLFLGQLSVISQLGGEQTEPESAPVVIAFSLKPLKNPRADCPAGTEWTGSACTRVITADNCPLGTIAGGPDGCRPKPIVPPASSKTRAKELIRQLVEADAARRVRTLAELADLYTASEGAARATVLATLAGDREIEAACRRESGAGDASRRSPGVFRSNEFATAYVPEPAPVQQSVPCDEVARLLAAYATLLEAANQLDAAADINLRLVRQHPKSPSSAPAFKSAADKLCRGQQYQEARRLYRYIREHFSETPTARSLPPEPCQSPPLAE